MGSFDQKSAAVLAEMRQSKTPGGRAVCLSAFAAKAQREGLLSLYEHYLLMGEALGLERESCVQPAYGRRVQISDLLKAMNMRMMALLFGDDGAAALWESWGREALRLNQERRKHYILEDYPAFLRAEEQPERLKRLLALRRSRKKPFDGGPYHDECFPYDQCAYEELLLQGRRFSEADKRLSGETENLLIELSLLEE